MGITEGHYRACLQGIRQRWRREPGLTVTGAQILVDNSLAWIESLPSFAEPIKWPHLTREFSWTQLAFLSDFDFQPISHTSHGAHSITTQAGKPIHSPAPVLSIASNAWPESWEPTEPILQPHRQPGQHLAQLFSFASGPTYPESLNNDPGQP